MQTFDLGAEGLRALNSALHGLKGQTNMTAWDVINPKGAHAIAAGVDAPVEINVHGSTGYYCAGMNQQATIRIKGSAGPGVAENMMSGTVIVDGDASQYAGATGRGGLLVIKGNASSRCGISMKGIEIVVHGSIGHMSCFMAQSGVDRCAGQCRRCAGGFALRGEAVCARFGEKSWRGLCREGNAARAYRLAGGFAAAGRGGSQGQAVRVPPLWIGPEVV